MPSTAVSHQFRPGHFKDKKEYDDMLNDAKLGMEGELKKLVGTFKSIDIIEGCHNVTGVSFANIIRTRRPSMGLSKLVRYTPSGESVTFRMDFGERMSNWEVRNAVSKAASQNQDWASLFTTQSWRYMLWRILDSRFDVKAPYHWV